MRASNSDKHSDDRGVVDALVQALSHISGVVPPQPPSELAVPEPKLDPRATATIAAVGELVPPLSGASSGAVVVPVGRGDSDGARGSGLPSPEPSGETSSWWIAALKAYSPASILTCAAKTTCGRAKTRSSMR